MQEWYSTAIPVTASISPVPVPRYDFGTPGTGFSKYRGTLGNPWYPPLEIPGYARYRLRELPGYARYPPLPTSRNTGVRTVPPGTGFSEYRGTLGTPRYPMKIPVPTICTITIPDTDPFVGHSISVELLYYYYFILLGLLFI